MRVRRKIRSDYDGGCDCYDCGNLRFNGRYVEDENDLAAGFDIVGSKKVVSGLLCGRQRNLKLI
jgi:hypothetical protein